MVQCYTCAACCCCCNCCCYCCNKKDDYETLHFFACGAPIDRLLKTSRCFYEQRHHNITTSLHPQAARINPGSWGRGEILFRRSHFNDIKRTLELDVKRTILEIPSWLLTFSHSDRENTIRPLAKTQDRSFLSLCTHGTVGRRCTEFNSYDEDRSSLPDARPPRRFGKWR